jgi:hypothetical protein
MIVPIFNTYKTGNYFGKQARQTTLLFPTGKVKRRSSESFFL